MPDYQSQIRDAITKLLKTRSSTNIGTIISHLIKQDIEPDLRSHLYSLKRSFESNPRDTYQFFRNLGFKIVDENNDHDQRIMLSEVQSLRDIVIQYDGISPREAIAVAGKKDPANVQNYAEMNELNDDQLDDLFTKMLDTDDVELGEQSEYSAITDKYQLNPEITGVFDSILTDTVTTLKILFDKAEVQGIGHHIKNLRASEPGLLIAILKDAGYELSSNSTGEELSEIKVCGKV